MCVCGFCYDTKCVITIQGFGGRLLLTAILKARVGHECVDFSQVKSSQHKLRYLKRIRTSQCGLTSLTSYLLLAATQTNNSPSVSLGTPSRGLRLDVAIPAGRNFRKKAWEYQRGIKEQLEQMQNVRSKMAPAVTATQEKEGDISWGSEFIKNTDIVCVAWGNCMLMLLFNLMFLQCLCCPLGQNDILNLNEAFTALTKG